MSSIHCPVSFLKPAVPGGQQEDYGKVTEAFFSKTRIGIVMRAENKTDMTEKTCQGIHVLHSNVFAFSCCCITGTSGYPKIVTIQ